MNLSKNLIVALLGLGCYAHCNNINLANNTTVLLIILALLAKWRTNEDRETETETETRTTRTTVSYQDTNSGNTTTRTVYGMPSFQSGFPFNTTTYQTTMPFNSGMMSNGNWGCPYCNTSSSSTVF